MKNLIIPAAYSPILTLRETQSAVKYIKDTFQLKLAETLNLSRVTAPIIVSSDSGINDDLNGVERKVTFTMKELDGTAEVVQSLAKWKRMALYRYGFGVGEGIYTDMNAVRRDDDIDNIHSLFVDQWDWERVILPQDRNLDFLKRVVRSIVGAVVCTSECVRQRFPRVGVSLCDDVYFITSQELEDRFPSLSPKERENEIVREKKTVFLMQIGAPLKSGVKHDGRAPDYDDWSLNGDLLFWNEVLGMAFEVSSMGIRVDARSLESQLEQSGVSERKRFEFHSKILDSTLPLTIGGGIGQSRLCMLMLGKAHIGEVQVSVWPEEMYAEASKHGIALLR